MIWTNLAHFLIVQHVSDTYLQAINSSKRLRGAFFLGFKMETLPANPIETSIVISNKIEKIIVDLCELAKEEKVGLEDLVRIWTALPFDDRGGMTYLERASECILEVSSLVNKYHPADTTAQKTARKLRIMSGLLKIKAEQLE